MRLKTLTNMKISQPHIIGKFQSKLPMTGVSHSQKASNAESVSISWRHNGVAFRDKNGRSIIRILGKLLESLHVLGGELVQLSW